MTLQPTVLAPDPPDRGLARNFLALASGEAVARAVAFVATIYVARQLGAEAYGIIGFALAVVLYLSRIADGGMEYFGLGIREIAADPDRVRTAAPHLIAARLWAGLVLAALLAGAALLMPSPDGAVLAVSGLMLLAIGGSTRWIHLGLEQARVVAVARTLGEVVMLGLVLAFVHGREDIVRVPLAQFIGDVLAALLLLALVRRAGFRLRLRFDPAVVAPVFRRSLPLVGSALLGLLIYNSDLIFLRFLRDAEAVGYYAAGYALISFMLNLGGTYGQSLLPALTRLNSALADGVRLYHTAIAQVFAVTLPIAAGGCVVAAGVIDLVFGAGYASSVRPLQILIWTVPLALLREVATVALVVGGRQRAVLRLTGGAAAMNVVLNLALIPPFGLVGAAVATLLTELARLVVAFRCAREAGFSMAGVRRFWRAVVAAGVMAAVVVLADTGALWFAVGIGIATYAGVLAALGGIRIGKHSRRPALTV